MRDYPFSFNELKTFSKNLPYDNIPVEYKDLYSQLKSIEKNINFPAISDDVGVFINFIFSWIKPKTIFEFGSGYGQSAFWYLLNNPSIKQVILTERRKDLRDTFEILPWPKEWKDKLVYNQADAFEIFKEVEQVDFILIDGVKADYLKFLKEAEDKISDNGLILIDNSYWRGSFLNEKKVREKETARKIKELHQFIAQSSLFESVFIPFEDGVTMLRKTI